MARARGSAPPATAAENGRGAGYMLFSQLAFVLNDALVAVALATVGVFEAIFLRGIGATALVLLLAWRAGAFALRIGPRDLGRIALRSLAEVCATLSYLVALASVGLTLTVAIFQATPLAVTLAAALFLGERVGWRRATAICLGFAGVMLITRPGTEAFDPRSLWVLAAVCFVVLRDFATRGLSPSVPSVTVTLATSVTITLAGAVGAAATDWVAPDAELILVLAGSAGFLVLGYLYSVKTMRTGDVSFVSPFRYSALVFAMLVGFLAWGDLPDAATIAGSAIVIGSGLFTFWRERRLALARAG